MSIGFWARYVGRSTMIAALCLPQTAWAQNTAPDEQLDTILAPASDRAPLVGCAALFRAFRLYAGEDTEVGQSATEREQDMIVFATLVWQASENLSMDDALAAIIPILADATELYLDRFVENNETTGSVFGDNLEGRVTFCNALRDELVESVQ